MASIKVKMMSENALIYFKNNLSRITQKILENDDNKWIYTEFPDPMFIEKKFEFDDFELTDNPESADKTIDYNNSVLIYERLCKLPRYVLCDERFWLWLHFDKFYLLVKNFMKVRGDSTIRDHWMHAGGNRRGLMFGILSRLYFRVFLTVDEKLEDKYMLTKWVIENPERFRNLTWRSFSSEEHLVRGILKGEKKALEDSGVKENNDWYPEIAKCVSIIGSVRILDVISEDDIKSMIYDKMIEIIERGTTKE